MFCFVVCVSGVSVYECAWYHNTFLVHLSLGNKVVLYCIVLYCIVLSAAQGHLCERERQTDRERERQRERERERERERFVS